MSSVADTKPRVPSLFEPGAGYNEFEQSTEETDKSTEEEKDNKLTEMFNHLAQRNFVARRGRNNRLLMKPILENVFKDKQGDENNEKAQIKGQNYYLEKYKRVWLSKRDKNGAALDNKPRKRAKRSNFEICLEEYPNLKEYALQRSLTVDRGNSRMAKNAIKVGNCDLKSVMSKSSADLIF